jgi:hypothetical protein
MAGKQGRIDQDRGSMDAERPLTEAHYRELPPFSRRLVAATVNGRSAAGKFIAAYRRELLDHLGRAPSTVEMRIVERAAFLAAHLMMLDRRAFKENGLSPRTMREYLALNNALVRTLASLKPVDDGDGEAKPRGAGLRAHLRALHGQSDAECGPP